MNWIALKMLTGDRSKYLGIVFGVAFASLLMAHQVSIFCGIMRRTTSQIRDVEEASIWVMDPHLQYSEEIQPLADTDLYRIRGVEGVDWAVPFFKGLVRARKTDGSRAERGDYRQVMLLGIDDATLIGAPRTMVLGELADLKRPDTVVIDEAGFKYLWPDEPFSTGKLLEMNDRRAVVVGVCKASAPFQTMPIMYTRYSQAIQYAPTERRLLSFVLARHKPDASPAAVCDRIEEKTGLQAVSKDGFGWKTMRYYLKNTGIPVNFGITVALGFIVGVAIAGQTFYLFTIENLKQFGALKAMGVTNVSIVGMVLLQAFVVGLIGYGIGMGFAAAFFVATKNVTALSGFFLPWQVMAGTGLAVLLIVLMSSLVSIRRVLVLEPAIVFRG